MCSSGVDPIKKVEETVSLVGTEAEKNFQFPTFEEASANLVIPNTADLIQQLDDFYQGSDVDKTLEDVQDFLEDPTKGLRDTKDSVEEEYDKLKEVGANVQEDAEDAADALQNELTNVITNTTNIGTSVSNQIREALGITPRPTDDQFNAMASIEGDPRLASLLARRRRARKQGKSQLRKGGGLYIPLKAGILVQTRCPLM